MTAPTVRQPPVTSTPRSGCLTGVGLLAFLAAYAASGQASAQSVNIAQNSGFDESTTSYAPWEIQENNCAYLFWDWGLETGEYSTLEVSNYNGCEYPNAYDLQIGQVVALRAGYTYQISFWAQDTYGEGNTVHVVLGNDEADFYREEDVFVPNQVSSTEYGLAYQSPAFLVEDDAVAWFGLFVGNSWEFKLDSLMLVETPPGEEPLPSGDVFVNQQGYAIASPKVATVRTSETAPLTWELRDSAGSLLAQGETTVMGLDPASGDSVHLADFSSYQTAGENLHLAVGDSQSEPFSVSNAVYGELKTDALRFFYHQRSGTPITEPYAGGAAWERAAGHPDTSVSCFSGCSYSLDVSRGWYDAGDYGKYVVNGGIAVWTLQNQYERILQLGTTLGDFGDGTLNIPEGGNGRPDLLDEVRWELEFLLAMQVPEGEAYAGMAHHKVHADEWAARPIWPEDDDLPRSLHPPSTAATLNLAATAAQGARLWAGLDEAFSTRCRTAAERAWTAAGENPTRYASSTDDEGGGSYSDEDVSDEFYWAAAELYVTTGNAAYADYLRSSPHWASVPSAVGPFSWPGTAGLGTVSLAIVPNGLSVAEITAMRQAIVAAADAFTTLSEGGYGAPIPIFAWGSNSEVLNAAIVMALAHDITGEARYRSGATAAMDYLLGRNPLKQCYVTGYGENPFSNVHHRIFAHDVDSSFPVAPPGFVAGGPNVELDGLVSPGALEDCVGMTCWTDDSEAYGLTEVAINWNAPLAWLAAWLDEMAKDPPTGPLGIDTGFQGHPGTGGTGGAGGSGGTSGSGGTGGSGSGGTGTGGANTDPGTGGTTADPGTGGTAADPGTGGTTGDPGGGPAAGGTPDDVGGVGGETSSGGTQADPHTDSGGEGPNANSDAGDQNAGQDEDDEDNDSEDEEDEEGEDREDGEDEGRCVEGETQICTGTKRCEGVQVCDEDAKWGPCDCGEAPQTKEGGDGCGCRIVDEHQSRSRAPAALALSALVALGRLRRRGPRLSR